MDSGSAKVRHLDTHILVTLYEGRVDRLSTAARHAIDSGILVASPAAVLELEFLREIGRLKLAASKLIAALVAEIGLQICDLPFRSVVEQAFHEAWTRDPFDRLIVANAKAASAPLITSDEKILAHYSRAIW